MRAVMYYAISAVLLLATVPMYRYILKQSDLAVDLANGPPQSRRAPAMRPITAAELRGHRVDLGLRTYYAYGDPLPEGYRCSGAGGMVYRTHEKNGSTVIDPLVFAGVQVRCGGDDRSSYRTK